MSFPVTRLKEIDCIETASDGLAFRIVCNDGAELEISDKQAEIMMEKCDFFRSVFAHGTTEASQRAIQKPDWNLSTAKAILELLTKKETVLRDIESLESIKDASQQLLLYPEIVFKPPSFVKESNNHTLDESLVREHLQQRESTASRQAIILELQKPKGIKLEIWKHLVSQNISVSDGKEEPCTMVLQSPKSIGPPPSSSLAWETFQMLGLAFEDGLQGPFVNTYTVRRSSPNLTIGKTMHALCAALRQSDTAGNSSRRVFENEEFSLRVPCGLYFRIHWHHHGENNQNGARVFFHDKNSLGYYLDGSNDGCCPTISGSVEQISATLEGIPENVIAKYDGRLSQDKQPCQRCSLRVTSPSTGTLDRLTKALGSCMDHPNSLGVDLASNCYFAVKTVRDMKALLRALIESSSDAACQSNNNDVDIALVSLTYPKGVF